MADGNRTLVDPNARKSPTWLDYLQLGSSAAGGYANAAAQSRAAELEARLGQEELRGSGEKAYNDAIAQRERDRQDSAASAYKRLLNYDFINSGGTKTPMVSPYSRPVQGPGENAKRLASDAGIVDELHKRASFGDPYFPGSPGLSDSNIGRLRVPGSDNPGDVYSRLMIDPAGTGEKIAGAAGVAAPFIGAASKGGGFIDWLKHLFGGGRGGGQGPGANSNVGSGFPMGSNTYPLTGSANPSPIYGSRVIGPDGQILFNNQN